jgi:hypothetical protein
MVIPLQTHGRMLRKSEKCSQSYFLVDLTHSIKMAVSSEKYKELVTQ